MRVIGRILYAMLAVFTFWFAFNYAQSRMAYLYFQDKGIEALTYDNDAFFYGSGRDYNSHEALANIEFSNIRITFYETADADDTQSDLIVDTYITAVLVSDTDIEDTYFISFKNGENTQTLKFFRFQTLNIAMLLNEHNNEYGVLSDVLVDQYTSVEIYSQDDELLHTESFELTNDMLKIEDAVTNYYDTNNELPFTELEDQDIYPMLSHSISDYMHVMYITIAIYLVILLTSFYIVFVLRRKYMGRKKPSIYFKREQEKYKK